MPELVDRDGDAGLTADSGCSSTAEVRPTPDPTVGHELRSLGKHSLVYGTGVMISKLAGFVMLPIYTRFLTPADYGVMELLSMTVEVIGTVAGIGLASNVMKFYAEYEDPAEKQETLSTAAIAILTLAAVTTIFGLLASTHLSEVVLKQDGRPLYFQIFFLIYLLTTAEALPLLLLRILNRSALFVALSTAKLLVMLILNIYFVVHLRMGVVGVLASNLAATAVSSTVLTIFLFRHSGLRFSWMKLKEMVIFSYPIMFVFLGNFVLVFSDRYFLSHFAGNSQVGIYSLAYKFAFILSAFAFTPFNMVWAPQRFRIARQGNAAEVFSRVFVYLNLALGGVAMLIALFIRDFLAVMADPVFLPAYRLVPVLLLAQVVHHWTMYANLGYFITNRTHHFAYASYVGVVAVLLFNILLIPYFGIWGAACATLFAYGMRFVAVNHFSQRHYRIDYRWTLIGRMYLIFGGVIGVRFLLPSAPLAVSLAESVLLLAGATAVTYLTVISHTERVQLRNLLVRFKIALLFRAP